MYLCVAKKQTMNILLANRKHSMFLYSMNLPFYSGIEIKIDKYDIA